jgi:hypothetical protein
MKGISTTLSKVNFTTTSLRFSSKLLGLENRNGLSFNPRTTAASFLQGGRPRLGRLGYCSQTTEFPVLSSLIKNPNLRNLELSHILSRDLYEKHRKQILKERVQLKKLRKIPVIVVLEYSFFDRKLDQFDQRAYL